MEISKALVSLRNVGVRYPVKKGFFRYDSYWALKDVSIDICRGDIVGVIGRNGAGKSTLLKILSGIINPARGSVKFSKGVTCSMLSIRAGFIANLTGYQNIILSGLAMGLSLAEIKKRLDEIVAYSEIPMEFISRPVSSYSTGMKARLGFSVAVQLDPDVLLIDEAISVGDESFRRKSSGYVTSRVDRNETTVLVTHNLQLAADLCTKLVLIDAGTVVASGDSSEVIEHYKSKVV